MLEFIAEDELVEVTPGSIRLRKRDLDAQVRIAHYREEKWAHANVVVSNQ